MPESKNFFEGYSRSKDMLATIANKFTTATIENPWTLKSSGYIVSTNSTFNGKPHICLSKEVQNGDKVNLLFIDKYNTATNNIYGDIAVYSFWHDGCDVANDKYMYIAPFNVSMQYHSTQVADTDGTPQFGWYWMWVDNDGVAMTVFGNVGAAGTAAANYNFAYFGNAFPYHEKFKETFSWYATRCSGSPNRGGIVWDSSMRDFIYPEAAPHDWTFHGTRVLPVLFTASNNAASNPNSLLVNTFIASRPALTQASDQVINSSWGYTQVSELIQTHWFGNGQFLFCQPGTSLYRGDIVSIESEGCDYIFQAIGGSPEFYDNLLIKRMESVTNLLASGSIGNVTLNWKNPNKCYGVKIVKKAGSMPTSHNDGTAVFNENTDSGLSSGQNQTVTDSNAVAGQYFYRAFAYDSNGTYSVPVQSATCEITL